MRITYRTLGQLISRMNADQLDCDVTVEIASQNECFAAELRICGEEHDSLDLSHPVIYVNDLVDDAGERRNDIKELAQELCLALQTQNRREKLLCYLAQEREWDAVDFEFTYEGSDIPFDNSENNVFTGRIVEIDNNDIDQPICVEIDGADLWPEVDLIHSIRHADMDEDWYEL